MSQNNNSFEYNYSAKAQAEIKKIREKYIEKQSVEVDKMERLRQLDASVNRKGNIVSLVVGVLSALILGLGMSCCMVWGGKLFIVGIVIGLIGIVGICLAFPVYSYITAKERKRIAPEILRLTEDLLQ